MKTCACGKPAKKRGMCPTCYARAHRALAKAGLPTNRREMPKTPAKRVVRHGDRYSKGWVWDVEDREKGGCATVVLRVDDDCREEPRYNRVPLWKLAEMEPLRVEATNAVAVVFVGLAEAAA